MHEYSCVQQIFLTHVRNQERDDIHVINRLDLFADVLSKLTDEIDLTMQFLSEIRNVMQGNEVFCDNILKYSGHARIFMCPTDFSDTCKQSRKR